MVQTKQLMITVLLIGDAYPNWRMQRVHQYLDSNE